MINKYWVVRIEWLKGGPSESSFETRKEARKAMASAKEYQAEVGEFNELYPNTGEDGPASVVMYRVTEVTVANGHSVEFVRHYQRAR